MITCREASQLISRARDVRLAWRERLALRLHLLACEMCRRYGRQIEFIGRAAGMLEEALERHGDRLAGLDEQRRAEILEAVRRRIAEEGAALRSGGRPNGPGQEGEG